MTRPTLNPELRVKTGAPPDLKKEESRLNKAWNASSVEAQQAWLAEFVNESARRMAVQQIEEYFLPMYRERFDAQFAIRGMDTYSDRRPFTHDQFRIMRAALHPDCQNADWKRDSIALLDQHVLRLQKDAPRPWPKGMPRTHAEMIACRKSRPSYNPEAAAIWDAARAKETVST